MAFEGNAHLILLYDVSENMYPTAAADLIVMIGHDLEFLFSGLSEQLSDLEIYENEF